MLKRKRSYMSTKYPSAATSTGTLKIWPAIFSLSDIAIN
jgi:hypothetical protein